MKATRKSKVEAPATVPDYQPTEREQAAIARVRQSMKDRKTNDRLKVDKAGVAPDHKDVLTGTMLQMDALGLASGDAYVLYLNQLVNAVTKGREPDELHLNGALGFVKSMQPRDDLEALLLAQMVATHNLTMSFARRLNHVENIPQQDSASNAYNKLARTFAAQMQTFKQYRTGGEQRVIVQRVDVRDGGQAIVGTVNNSQPGGGGNDRTGEQPHALADTRSTSMLCQVEEERAPVPRASRAR